jgi:putative DNA primase/helicase
MAEEHYTDLGNAQRLVERHAKDLRYCADTRKWLVWDGQRWQVDATGKAMRLAKETVRAQYRAAGTILNKAEGIVDDVDRKEVVAAAKRLMAFALTSESRSKLEAMLKLAETELPIPVTVEQLDAAPWLLNVQNGTIDLRTGHLKPHDRDDLITRICPIAYDPTALDERFEMFLGDILPDQDVEWYVQKALGYSTTGDAREGNLFLPYGETHTGKTTLLEAVKSTLGDYAITVDVETLTGSQRNRDGSRARYDLVRLIGTRFAVSTEVPAGAKLDDALVKKLTGGDTFVARGVYEREGQEARATFSIWLGSNYRPRVRDDDDAVWQRVRQIPFDQQHAGAKRDGTLKPYLESEGRQAILKWLVDGAMGYALEGLAAPAAVKTLTEAYRAEMNPLSFWADECCTVDPDTSATYEELKFSYDSFTPIRERVGPKRFQHSLKSLPGVSYSKDLRKWVGIRVHEPGSGITNGLGIEELMSEIQGATQ